MDQGEHKAYLSLRQSEILEKLQHATVDPELEKVKPESWYVVGFGVHCAGITSEHVLTSA